MSMSTWRTVAACGHVIPAHHESAWHDHRGNLFCSLNCLADSGYGSDSVEYDALSEYQRGAYDYLGQRGGTHAECMEAALSI